MKYLMKDERKNYIDNIIIIFLLIQPIMDMYMAIIGEKMDLFGFSIVTLIRVVTITALFGITVYNILKNNWKKIPKVIWVGLTYMGLLAVYTVAHHYNITLNKYYMDNNLYNIMSEMLYIMRLIIPIVFIYIIYNNKIEKKNLINIMTIVATIISVIIVVTNILGVSFIAYANDNSIIKGNIFSWFGSEKINYKLLTSKGLFDSANQIGSLLALLLPITILNAIKNNKWFYYLMTFIQIIAMIMIGSRIASVGWLIITIAVLLIYIVLSIVRKEEKIKKTTVFVMISIIIVCSYITTKSPVTGKEITKADAESYAIQQVKLKETNIEEYIKESIYSDEKLYVLVDNVLSNKISLGKTYDVEKLKVLSQEGDINKIRNDVLNGYIEGYYNYNYINSTYIEEIYPHEDDPDFWLEMFEQPFYIKADNRGLQKAVIERLKENNSNTLTDTLFGMGATPLNKRSFMIENDFIGHYYNLGILGTVLFLFPYVIIVITSGIIMIMKFKEKFTIDNTIYMFSIIIAFGAGLLGGHVFDEYIATFFIAYIAAMLLKNCVSKD